MGLPHVAATTQRLHEIEDGSEEFFQIRECLDPKWGIAHIRIGVFVTHHPLREEVDERVGLRVDVVAIEQHFGVVQHFPQAPHQRFRIVSQVRMGTQGVEVDAVRFERREIGEIGERFGSEPQTSIQRLILLVEFGRLVEEAQIGALDVETDGRHRSLVTREGLEHARQEELHRAGLRGESGNTGDPEMCGFRPQQKVRVEVHRRLEPTGGIHPDRHTGGPLAGDIGVHAQCRDHIGVAGHIDRREGYGLERLLGYLAQH